METLEEDVEEYSWREVVLPHLVPVVPDAQPELERETVERRRGRDLLVAVDFGPNSKHAFDWALAHIARIADTVHLVHAVRTKARIVEGDAGKVICREADRLKPAAVILGTRGRGLIQRYTALKPHITYICATFRCSGLSDSLANLCVLQGSVSEYCFHNCKAAPIIIVPGKG
nr:unnamed protein product [Digitaria exilis]